jgi:hypothetical protein
MQIKKNKNYFLKTYVQLKISENSLFRAKKDEIKNPSSPDKIL